MGEVFPAKDTRLDRTVAIKVLAPALAANPDFRDRFEREARAVSALAHPNICALYDVGREPLSRGDGTAVDFLVMQFVAGETLATRVSRGPLKIREVLRLATEIASALDKAHRSNIVHRDLKPGNIMID
jgi:serine/threonine protein kinase